MKTLISSEAMPTPVGPYSPCLLVEGWIFLSGQGGFDPETGKMISSEKEMTSPPGSPVALLEGSTG